MLAERLSATLAIFQPYVSVAALSFAETCSRSAFAEYLRRLRHIVRASVPLMDEARTRIYSSGYGNPAVIDYLAHHIIEESGHDRWLENDLKEVEDGVGLSDEPHATAMRFVGEAHYLIRYCSPLAVLGYIAAIETAPPTNEYLGSLERVANGKGLFALTEHARLDAGHAADFWSLLSGVDAQDHWYPIVLCAERTMCNTLELFADLSSATYQ